MIQIGKCKWLVVSLYRETIIVDAFDGKQFLSLHRIQTPLHVENLGIHSWPNSTKPFTKVK